MLVYIDDPPNQHTPSENTPTHLRVMAKPAHIPKIMKNDPVEDMLYVFLTKKSSTIVFCLKMVDT